MTKMILVVDDDETVCEFLQTVLKREGFTVITARDGAEAIREATNSKPDMIVLDLMLPRFGGFEVLRHLQQPQTAQIPIIAFTGRYTDRTTQDFIRSEANVVDFFEKPLKAPVLTSRIHSILGSCPPAN